MNAIVRQSASTLFAGCRHQSSRHLQQTVRRYSQALVSGMPRERVSLLEKVVHGVIISTSMLATPVWVLYHIKYYRGEPALSSWNDDLAAQDITMPGQATEHRYGRIEEQKRGSIDEDREVGASGGVVRYK